jgi:hypothetical protein
VGRAIDRVDCYNYGSVIGSGGVPLNTELRAGAGEIMGGENRTLWTI